MSQQFDGALLNSGACVFYVVPFEVLRRFRVAEDRVDDAKKLFEGDQANPIPKSPTPDLVVRGFVASGQPVVVVGWCPDWNGRVAWPEIDIDAFTPPPDR
jgi:hypothetical protein